MKKREKELLDFVANLVMGFCTIIMITGSYGAFCAFVMRQWMLAIVLLIVVVIAGYVVCHLADLMVEKVRN